MSILSEIVPAMKSSLNGSIFANSSRLYLQSERTFRRVMVVTKTNAKEVFYHFVTLFRVISNLTVSEPTQHPPSKMSQQPNKRRRTNAIGPDSLVFAKALTHKTITTTNRSGIEQKKKILVPLIPIKPIESLDETAGSSSNNIPTMHDYEENRDMDDPLFCDNDGQFNTGTGSGSNHNKSKVNIFIFLSKYIQSFILNLETTRLSSAICGSNSRITDCDSISGKST